MLTAAQKTYFGTRSPMEPLGPVLVQKKGVLTAVYDFSVQGGAIGSLNLLDMDGNPALLPAGAIITNCTFDVITALTTSASGTMAVNSEGAGDLKAALAAASWTGKLAGVPVGTAATWVKLTAQRQIVATIATGAITAGKWYAFIEFLLSSAT
jgi:hypothetical protein